MVTTADALEDDETARAVLVSAAVQGWQRQLAPVGGPNSLLWDAGISADQRLDLTTAHPAGMARLLSSGEVRVSELFREPASRARVLAQARKVAQLANRLHDDFGLASCYLAAGTATWSWTGADRTPRPPVLLRAATLRSVADDVHLVVSDTIEVNPVLTATLSALGVELDTDAVRDAGSVGTNFDPRGAYKIVRAAASDLMDFRIDPVLLVGVFSHFKVPLVRDLAQQQETLVQGHLVAAFAGDPQEMHEVAALPEQFAERDPRDELLPVDLDAVQQDVVDAVVSGANVCVLGAAGTGKTRTASALIATLADQGRRVLYVSHARASLLAVQDELAAVGLEDLILDLGRADRSARDMVADLSRTLHDAAGVAGQASPVDVDVAALRSRIQQHHALMHEKLQPWGVTLDAAQDRLTRLSASDAPPRSRVRLSGTTLSGIDDRRRRDLQEKLSSVVAAGAWSTQGEVDAWFGARLVGREQLERSRSLVERLARGELRTHRSSWEKLCADLGLSVPGNLVDEEHLLELLRQVHQTLEIFQPEIFDAPLDDMVVAMAPRRDRSNTSQRIGPIERRRLERQARGLLRPGAPPRDLRAVLVRALEQRQEWRTAAGPGARPKTRTTVPEFARRTEALREDLEWLGDRLTATADGGELLETPYEQMQSRLELLASQPHRLQAAGSSLATLDTLREYGLEEFLSDVASRQVSGSQAALELEFVWWASIIDHVAASTPDYDELSGEQIRAAAQRYVVADEQHVTTSSVRLRSAVAAQRSNAGRDLPEQVGVLERHRGRAGDLLELAPELSAALAPCWATSPFAVPDHLPPGMWFDVVIVDDASTVGTAQAIPAIARGGQLVVVGDVAGAPPLPFPTGPAVPVGEVLLDRARELFPVRTLPTHYRSLDERLFGFAAARVYDEHTMTFPAADLSGGVRLDVVGAARYEAGSSPAEVDRVIEVLLDQWRLYPQESVVVIAFDTQHADHILEALRGVAGVDRGAARLLNEAQVVTTAERSSGVVRDAVIIATGVGRDARGRVPSRLGAVSQAGGERLVTAAITRARRRVVVVSGISGEDLDPTVLRSRGALLLRDYLLYAASGGSARRITDDAGSATAGRRRRTASTGSVLDTPTARAVDQGSSSVAVEDLARRLTAEGLIVHTAHGLSEPRIDLVIEDPQRRGDLLVAVETDGANYGAMPFTRDRERIRPAQLRTRGWAHERVLTRDLFRDPAKEVARLIRAANAASARRNATPGLSPAHDENAGTRA